MRYLPFMLFLLIAFSSCLDVVEEVTLRQDGSGSIRMQIDLAPGEAGSAEGSGVAADFLKGKGLKLDSLRLALGRQEGVRNSYCNVEGSMLVWGYDFDHVDAMKGNQKFQRMGDKSGMGPARYALERADKKYYWLVRRHVPEDLNEWTGSGLFRNLSSHLMGEGSYTLIYHLPARVKEVSHPEAMLSDRKRTVSLRVPIKEWIADPVSADLRMRFKRKPKYREPW